MSTLHSFQTLKDNKTGIIIQSILSICIIIFGIILFRIIYLRRKKFPYNNANPFWILVIIFFAIVIQIINMVFHIIILLDEKYFLKLRKTTILFINGLILLAIIARLFSVKCCIQFNYEKLMAQITGSKDTRDNQGGGNKKIFSRAFYKRRFTYFKSFLMIYVFFFFFFFIYYSIIIDLNPTLIDTIINILYFSTPKITITASLIIDLLIPYILYAITFILNAYFIINIMKFPIKTDKFKFKREIISLYIITLTFFDIKVFFLITGTISNDVIYIIDSFFPLCIIVLYYYITSIREKSFRNINVNDIVENFDEFAHRNITFQLFYAYVETNSRNHIGFLSFLADYYIYKEIVEKLNKERKGTFSTVNKMNLQRFEKELAKKGKEIYKDYFKSIDSSEDISAKSGTVSIEKSDVNLIDIHFPIDIFEKVKEAYDANFEQDNVETIYDEPFTWVRGELKKVFEVFKEQEEEMVKLERIMFFVNIFEIK